MNNPHKSRANESKIRKLNPIGEKNGDGKFKSVDRAPKKSINVNNPKAIPFCFGIKLDKAVNVIGIVILKSRTPNVPKKKPIILF